MRSGGMVKPAKGGRRHVLPFVRIQERSKRAPVTFFQHHEVRMHRVNHNRDNYGANGWHGPAKLGRGRMSQPPHKGKRWSA